MSAAGSRPRHRRTELAGDGVRKPRHRRALMVGATLLIGSGALAQTPGELSGDAQRGKGLYEHTYKCYACHGYDAQSIEPRLKPMNFTQEGFITFVQNSPLALMPAYSDAPAQDLADVYAYIRSIPLDAPELDEVPLLREISEGHTEVFE
jgi:mono/diheme cytochrome c family protein